MHEVMQIFILFYINIFHSHISEENLLMGKFSFKYKTTYLYKAILKMMKRWKIVAFDVN